MMATTTSSHIDQRVILHGVAWDTYERLLADHVNSSAPRFTYDRGELEILSPSPEHERDNRKLALLVEIVALELATEIDNVGSMTFKSHELLRGFEPDSGLYIQSESRIRGKAQIDLSVDPPPDLIIEIEATRLAIHKLPIYAALGVPEVWRSDGERVTIHRLISGEYAKGLPSMALPPLTSEILTDFLRASRSMRRTEWLRHIREWARGA